MHTTDPIGRLRPSFATVAALLAAGLAFSLAAPACGAEARNQSAFADTTKPVMFLEETVVTGARYPRTYYESPQALSFVSRQALAEEG